MAEKRVNRGSIVRIRYPFTDLAGLKVRPAVVLTPERLLARIEDVLCLFISSSIQHEPFETDFFLKRTHSSFKQTGLKLPYIFRTHKLALLHKSLVIRKLGDLEDVLMSEINKRLKIALGLD